MEKNPQLKLYEMISSITKPMALRSAVLLQIPDIISDATAIHESNSVLSTEEIASHMSPPPANLECLFRTMRYLASIDVFSETPKGGDIHHCKFGLTPISEMLVQKQGNQQIQHSWAPYLLFVTNKTCLPSLGRLHDSVLENCTPFNKECGVDIWEYARKDPIFRKVCVEGMVSFSQSVMPYVVEAYHGFRDINTLVDVGGGVGFSFLAIIKKYPHIQGVNFDLPSVVAAAPPIPGVKHVSGSMFESIPPADAVFLKWVLHNWDDEHAKKILEKCYEAIPENGKVIIVEAIVEREGSLRPLQLCMDIMMLSFNSGAKERNEEEFKTIFEASGFKSFNVIKLPWLGSIIELSKS